MFRVVICCICTCLSQQARSFHRLLTVGNCTLFCFTHSLYCIPNKEEEFSHCSSIVFFLFFFFFSREKRGGRGGRWGVCKVWTTKIAPSLHLVPFWEGHVRQRSGTSLSLTAQQCYDTTRTWANQGCIQSRSQTLEPSWLCETRMHQPWHRVDNTRGNSSVNSNCVPGGRRTSKFFGPEVLQNVNPCACDKELQ